MKGCAGLGNRLVTVMSAIRYANQNQRVLVVDWSDGQFDKKGTDAFEKCFTLKNVSHISPGEVKDWESMSHSSELFKNNRNEGLYDLYVEYQSPFFLKFPERLFSVTGLSKLRRCWKPVAAGQPALPFGGDLKDGQPEDVLYYIDFLPAIAYDALPDYLELKPAIEKKINDLSARMGLKEAVGLHIRSTDKKPTRPVEEVIDHLKKHHPGQPVYLSTDSTQIEELFAASFAKLLLLPKTKPELKGEGLHQWALYNKQEELKYVIYEESVLEMFLLSKCKTLYYQGNSTFSNISKVYHADRQQCHDWQSL